ncbi:hypothetical protein ACMD2_21637 [Ananas comosus]|uniref:Uncharacterized protein n=1 Tax=Ananas comosus TaxID=4615 RepID=A0A199UKJ9_ANACO|nr:hypothetical protein ACMD2_21637 [Ananas comosus]
MAFHSNSHTKLLTKYSRCSIANPYPGHILLPTPKGIILISLLPVMSTASPSPPSRNLSGRNSIGSSQTFPSHPISATIKFTSAPFGTQYSPSIILAVTVCGNTKCAGGCLRNPSRITAFRAGIDQVRSKNFWKTFEYAIVGQNA